MRRHGHEDGSNLELSWTGLSWLIMLSFVKQTQKKEEPHRLPEQATTKQEEEHDAACLAGCLTFLHFQ